MSATKRFIRKIPLLGSGLAKARKLLAPGVEFNNSAQYWEDRYRIGGDSGAGSYGRLASFKAKVLNRFVEEFQVDHVVEYGFGDGAQLSLANYRKYTGFDISKTAVETCRQKFSDKPQYDFLHTSENHDREGSYDLALSLDVIFHLVEDEVFDAYMKRLFRSSRRFVIIYAYNFERKTRSRHVLGREFMTWCDANAAQWRLIRHIENYYPYESANRESTSPSDFYIFELSA